MTLRDTFTAPALPNTGAGVRVTERDTVVHLPDVVGRGYKDFWEWRGRYLVCKGSRGSKKSTTAALKIVWEMMRNPDVNALVVRRFAVTHRDSTAAQLLWAIERLKARHLWRVRLSPLQLQFVGGGKILFRGFDKPESIQSLTTERGVVSLVWIEEAFQLKSEDAFNKLDLSIRGQMPPGVSPQFILTLNPWNRAHWVKSRFFDPYEADPEAARDGGRGILAMTTDYRVNEWLTERDVQLFEDMRIRHPRRYLVEGLGEWGATTGGVFTNWEVREFDIGTLLAHGDGRGHRTYQVRVGMDFGFTTDPTAVIALAVSAEKREIYVIDEIYGHGMTNRTIHDTVVSHGLHKSAIVADSADPRTINELRMLGLGRIRPSKKGPDSVRSGIQRIQDYKIIVHPRCANTIVELENYAWDTDKGGQEAIGKPIDDFNHLMDAMRYAMEDAQSGFTFDHTLPMALSL